VLTCKEPAADAVTGSKPEHETKVADAAVVDEILRAFGLEHLVATRAVSRLLSLEGAMSRGRIVVHIQQSCRVHPNGVMPPPPRRSRIRPSGSARVWMSCLPARAFRRQPRTGSRLAARPGRHHIRREVIPDGSAERRPW
jgi:hypothetical protein